MVFSDYGNSVVYRFAVTISADFDCTADF